MVGNTVIGFIRSKVNNAVFGVCTERENTRLSEAVRQTQIMFFIQNTGRISFPPSDWGRPPPRTFKPPLRLFQPPYLLRSLLRPSQSAKVSLTIPKALPASSSNVKRGEKKR